MPFSSSQTDSSKRHLLGQQCCTGASVSEKTQAMAAYAHSAHNAHTWPGTKWTTQQYLSPGWDAGLTVSYSAPHWWDRLTPLHKQAGGVGVTARRHDFILPLPARSLSGSATQKHARNEHRNTRSWFKRRCHRSPQCGSLSGGWMLSIGVTEISALGTQKKQKNLAMSQSLFESDSIKRQEMVTAVLWRSQTRASVYSWFIGAGTDTTSLWPCTNSRFLKVKTRK